MLLGDDDAAVRLQVEVLLPDQVNDSHLCINQAERIRRSSALHDHAMRFKTMRCDVSNPSDGGGQQIIGSIQWFMHAG